MDLRTLFLLVLAVGCTPRYVVKEGTETARVRFKASIHDWSRRGVEYATVLRDGDTCSTLGSVPLEQYRGPVFGSDHEKAKASFSASALALKLPATPDVDYGTIVKELPVAAGKPIVVVTTHKGAIDRTRNGRWVCKAETRFVPEPGADYEVSFQMLFEDRCYMSADRLVAEPEGKVKRVTASVPGQGCLKR